MATQVPFVFGDQQGKLYIIIATHDPAHDITFAPGSDLSGVLAAALHCFLIDRIGQSLSMVIAIPCCHCVVVIVVEPFDCYWLLVFVVGIAFVVFFSVVVLVVDW